jgi:alcohol dehydrogenase
MDNFSYSNPTKLLFGRDQLANLAEEIKPFGRKVLFVYGRRHLKESGTYNRILRNLKSREIECVELPGVQPNPRVGLVRKGIEICRNQEIDFILGAGGGSVSDTVKAIGMGAKVDYDIWQMYEDFNHKMHGNEGSFPHIPMETVPTGIIMTKPGTGSDFDYTSVLSNEETKEKLMVINKVMYPKFSLIDPEFAYTLPRDEAAYGIADNMSHILEQYLTLTLDTGVIDLYKEANLRTVVEYGPRVMENPRDYVAQSQLFYAASWACSDQSMTGTTGGWDSHLSEHEITAATDFNHGHGMSIIYLGWMHFMLEHMPEKFARFGENVWGIDRRGRSDTDVGAEAIEKTAEFFRSLGITLRLSENGIQNEIIDLISNRAVRFGPIGVICPLYGADVKKILESVW